MKTTLRVSLIGILAAASHSPGETWNVPAGNWNLAANWNPASVPSGTQALISSGTVTLDSAVPDIGAVDTDGMIMNGGSVLNISAGASLTNLGAGNIGLNTDATINISGGAITTNQNFNVGRDGGIGIVNQTGGTLTVGSQWLAIGLGGGAAGSKYDISGGTLNASAVGIEVGSDRAGELKISGTALVQAGSVGVGVRATGNGTLNQSGGTLAVSGNLAVGGTQGAGTGVYTLTGGTATAGTISVGSQAGNGTINYNGGTLSTGELAVASNRHFGDNNNGGQTGVVNINNTTLNTNGWVEVGRGVGSNGTVNITGPTALWNSSSGGDMQVGYNGGTGTINITGGGKMTHNWWINLGRGAGSTGTVKVDGAGSTLTTTAGRIVVGEDGTGTLEITNGGKVFHNSGEEFHVAVNAGSTGNAKISGAGSSLEKTGGNFFIGQRGTGVMTVENGGTLTVKGPEFRIGHVDNGDGTLNITSGAVVNFESKDGAGVWQNGNFLLAESNDAKGKINMNNGTLNVSAWGLDAGWNTPGNEATINMANNSVINILNGSGDHGRFFFGRGGKATMNQEGGQVNVAQWGAVGFEAGGEGIYNLGVGGGGGQLNVGGDFYVGRQSKGTLTLGTGASLTTGGVLNIAQETATALGTVTNNGGTVTVGGEFNVGRNVAGANGTYVQNSGVTQLNGTAIIGRDSATGIWTQNGGTSQINGELNLGMGGGTPATGVVNVSGGTMTVNGWTTLGRDGANVGTLNVNNGGMFKHTTVDSGDFLIGWANGSTGNINVASGGKLEYSWWTRVAVDPGSTGSVVVDGAGSEFNVTNGRVYIGEKGVGSLTVQNGGTFIHQSGHEFNVGGQDGGAGGGVGVITINGATSSVQNQDFIRVGYGNTGAVPSTGTVNINEGTIASGNWIGFGHEGGDGYLNMNKGTITFANEFYVGIDDNGHTRQTTGTANITGGTITQTGGGTGFIIGRNGGKGVVNVIGTDPVIMTGNNMYVGQGGVGAGGGTSNGTLNITNPNTSITIGNELNIGANGGTGVVSVGGGIMTVNGWTTMGRDGAGTATLNVKDGGHFNHPQNNGGDLMVGWVGGSTGAVNVTNGGKITQNWWIRAGIDSGSTGNILIDGTGSEINKAVGVGNVDARTNIGESGTGTLTIQNGGKMTDHGARFIVGRNQGGSGTMTVTNGSTFIHTPAVDVNDENWMTSVAGHNEDRSTVVGTLNVSGGPLGASTVTVNSLDIARNGGVGTLNLADSTINVLGHFSLGRQWEDDPALVPSNGTGTFVNGNVNYGSWFSVGHEGGTGVLSMNNSTITGNGDFNIGIDQNGAPTPTTGTVNMTGGTVTAPNVPVGRNGGTGTYNIYGGGTVTTNHFEVGLGGGANGTVLLDNGTINAVVGAGGSGYVNIGRDGGTGAMTMNNGTMNMTGEFNLGVGAGATGTLTVNGGIINSNPGAGQNSTTTNNWFIVGRDSAGTLTQNGGTINHTWVPDGGGGGGDRSVRIGNGAGAVGIYNLTGGTITTNTAFDIGHDATGTVNQSDGTINTVVAGDSRLTVGRYGAGNGTYNLSGGVANFQSVTIGDGGAAYVNQTGGTINSNQWTEVGQGTTGPAVVPTWDISGGTYNGATIGVGSRRAGIMNISGTAIVNPNEFIIGLYSDPLAAVPWFSSGVVTQSGGTLNASGAIVVGSAVGTTASLTMSGGLMKTLGGSELQIGSRTNTTSTFAHTGGTVDVQNIILGGNANTPSFSSTANLRFGEPLAVAGDVNARGNGAIRSGTANVGGTLLVNSGATLDVTGELNVNNGTPAGTAVAGNLNVTGGLAKVNGIANITGPVNVGATGTLAGTGTVTSPAVSISTGTLAPGTSPGTLTINGSLNVASGSTFSYELGAVAGPNDLTIVNGTATIPATSTLNIAAQPGYDPASGGGGIYTIVSATTMTSAPANLTVGAGSPANNAYVVTTTPTSLNLALIEHSEASLSAVTDLDSGSHDFGAFLPSIPSGSQSFSLNNMTGAYRLALSSAAPIVSGDTSLFTFDSAAPGLLNSGGSATYNALFNGSAVPGTYSITYTFPANSLLDSNNAASLLAGHTLGTVNGVDGTGATQSGNVVYTFSATVVIPEPGSLLGVGVALLLLRRRRA